MGESTHRLAARAASAVLATTGAAVLAIGLMSSGEPPVTSLAGGGEQAFPDHPPLACPFAMAGDLQLITHSACEEPPPDEEEPTTTTTDGGSTPTTHPPTTTSTPGSSTTSPASGTTVTTASGSPGATSTTGPSRESGCQADCDDTGTGGDGETTAPAEAANVSGSGRERGRGGAPAGASGRQEIELTNRDDAGNARADSGLQGAPALGALGGVGIALGAILLWLLGVHRWILFVVGKRRDRDDDEDARGPG